MRRRGSPGPISPKEGRERSASRSIPTSTARSIRSSSQSISSSAKVSAFWVAPELAGSLGAFGVEEHQDG